jgi:hypothetical protein
MWRPAHGATSKPGPCRPVNGYGRDLERPGPRASSPVDSERPAPALDPAVFVAFTDQEAAPAPVIP